jgi:hypothetical protein
MQHLFVSREILSNNINEEIAKKVSIRGCVFQVICDIIDQTYEHLTYLLDRKVQKWKIIPSIG